MPVYDSRGESPPAISQDGHGVSYQDLCDIIRARVEELLRLILLELPHGEYESLIPSGLVLTGGSSNLSGIETLGQELLHIPVRVGAPTKIPGVADELQDPKYATGVGLLLWGARHEGTGTWRGGFGNRLRGLVSQLRNLFG